MGKYVTCRTYISVALDQHLCHNAFFDLQRPNLQRINFR